MNVVNGPSTDVELAYDSIVVVIPSGDASVGGKCETIDGDALFAENESNVVFVDEKSGCECLERSRLSLEGHDCSCSRLVGVDECVSSRLVGSRE